MSSHNIKRLFVIILAVSVALCAFASCAKDPGIADDGQKSENKVTYGIPSVGVGRVSKTETPEKPPEKTGIVICIDPGHGFVDGGCGENLLGDLLEKDVNLAIAKLLDEDLQNLGYTTIMTHDGVNIPTWDTNSNKIFSATERVVYVNTLDIDYLVSIHVNSNSDTSVSGLWICYEQNARKVNDWSQGIAESISGAMTVNAVDVSKITLKNEYSLALTRETYAAASLIEIGFATNPSDAEKMLDPMWQSALAQSIADGIDDFFKGGDN